MDSGRSDDGAPLLLSFVASLRALADAARRATPVVRGDWVGVDVELRFRFDSEGEGVFVEEGGAWRLDGVLNGGVPLSLSSEGHRGRPPMTSKGVALRVFAEGVEGVDVVAAAAALRRPSRMLVEARARRCLVAQRSGVVLREERFSFQPTFCRGDETATRQSWRLASTSCTEYTSVAESDGAAFRL